MILFHIFLFADAIEIYVCQTLPDAKKSSIVVELQKLSSEWPLEVIRHQKEEDRKVYHLCNCFSCSIVCLRTQAYTLSLYPGISRIFNI